MTFQRQEDDGPERPLSPQGFDAVQADLEDALARYDAIMAEGKEVAAEIAAKRQALIDGTAAALQLIADKFPTLGAPVAPGAAAKAAKPAEPPAHD